ncbi:DUF3310 domain-containing protein [Streptomyces sp. NPDC048212]|uniref:DUF3310 domain-containing protein n=1 Tax=Streptomyces sp. NPDC048212 TaxID=3156658 RepID=UPI003404FBC2
MSNFEVGDRVVVVKNNHPGQGVNMLFKRGTIVRVEKKEEYEVGVVFEGRVKALYFDSSELELEGVYDALSAKPAEEVFSSNPEVDSRLVEEFLEGMSPPRDDVINSPSHYADGWSNGAEVIDITEHLNFNRGNAVKYLSRAGKKGGSEKELEDLQKALWYVSREVERLGGTV